MVLCLMIINDDVLVIPGCSCEYFQLIKIYLSSWAWSNYRIRGWTQAVITTFSKSLGSLISFVWLVHKKGYGASHWSKGWDPHNVMMMLKRSHGEMRTGADGSERFSETFHSSWNISKHFCEWAGDARWPVAWFFFINDFYWNCEILMFTASGSWGVSLSLTDGSCLLF